MTLQEAVENVGHDVIYRPAYGQAEEAHIVSVNNTQVFICPRGDWHSKATDPAHLTLLAGAYYCQGCTTPDGAS